MRSSQLKKYPHRTPPKYPICHAKNTFLALFQSSSHCNARFSSRPYPVTRPFTAVRPIIGKRYLLLYLYRLPSHPSRRIHERGLLTSKLSHLTRRSISLIINIHYRPLLFRSFKCIDRRFRRPSIRCRVIYPVSTTRDYIGTNNMI